MTRAAERAELAALTTADQRWQAVVARDAGADGKFFYSVRTSGVYCRPSCGARLARPENVQFHLTSHDAEKAGFRACKRCKPDQTLNAARSEVQIRFAIGDCSLGSVLVAQSSRGICAILMDDHPSLLVQDLERRFPDAKLSRDENGTEEFVRRVCELIEQPQIAMELPLDVRGTSFQQQVWKALQTIPAGRTASYKEIADKLGHSRAVRAVARACAANALAVAIPCHRAVRSNGKLAGYRWGLNRKRTLLEREARA